MSVDKVDMNASVESLVLAGMSRLLQVLPIPQEIWQIQLSPVPGFEVMIVHCCLQAV